MRSSASVILAATVASGVLLAAGAARGVEIETVHVGNAGNVADTASHSGNPAGQGGVSYEYHIGKYEVTAGQYCEFLNAVAKTDTYGLYNTNMDVANFIRGCNIKRSGAAGSYVYTIGTGSPQDVTNWANRPVNFVCFWDACRFTNWLSNGQPMGAQDASTTERGTYTLDGYKGNDGRSIQRNAGAKWAVTSEDEWYKAAYYDPNKPGGAGYWDYPTMSNTAPSSVGSDGYTDPGNHANYYPNGFTIGSPYYRTNVGEFENTMSAYDTFDQGGNVWELNESIPFETQTTANRGLRGGSFYVNSDATNLASTYHDNGHVPTTENGVVGFRVVQVPEPTSLALLGLGVVGFLRRRRGV